MHPDPHPPNTSHDFSVGPGTRQGGPLHPPSKARRTWLNLTRGSRPLLLLTGFGTVAGLGLAFGAWAAFTAGGHVGFVGGALLAITSLACFAGAFITLADALEWGA